MKETRYFFVPDAAQTNELPEEEAQHALKVLRLKEGDELMLMDGQGTFFEARVTVASGKHCYYEVTQALPQERPWKGRIHLAIAPTKMMDRMEWLVEKVISLLGTSGCSPMRSVPRKPGCIFKPMEYKAV